MSKLLWISVLLLLGACSRKPMDTEIFIASTDPKPASPPGYRITVHRLVPLPDPQDDYRFTGPGNRKVSYWAPPETQARIDELHLKGYPAVVFNRKLIVYGASDVHEALDLLEHGPD